jgi:Zn-dependent membrane protease YugP
MTGLYFIGLIVLLIISAVAQAQVKSKFSKFSRVRASSGMTGAQAAQHMLRQQGITNVGIERQGGFLSDHYDPRRKVIRLSPGVYDSNSLSAVGVACHEAGHAVQDARKYAPLVIRNAAVPIAGIGSNMSFVLIFIGLILNFTGLAVIGLLLFAGVVFFQVVNLPVEFNASSRAKEALVSYGIVSRGAEENGVSQVLNAAAMTYLAATLTAIFQLLYFALLVFGGRR